MTNRELIALLQTMPDDAIVIQTFCSDYRVVEAEQVSLIRPKERAIVIRDGRIHSYAPSHWPKDWTPNFITAIHFAGN